MSRLAVLTNLDVAFQYRYVLQGLTTDMTSQVLLQHTFCFGNIDLQATAFSQLCTGVRHIDEKGCCEGVPVFLVLECC